MRPGVWVSPLDGDWGQGAVQLVEIPSELESNDNIAAFWVPNEPIKAGEQHTFRYRLETFGNRRRAPELAAVESTRIGWAGKPESEKQTPRQVRRFHVRFAGGELEGLEAGQPLEARLTTSAGEITSVETRALPGDRGWRVDFVLGPHPDSRPSDLRLYLTLRGRRVSETWNYVWTPDQLEQGG